MVLTPPDRSIVPLPPSPSTPVHSIPATPAPDGSEIWWRLSFEVRRNGTWDRIERITGDEQSARAQLVGIGRLQARGDESVRNQKLERAVVTWGVVD